MIEPTFRKLLADPDRGVFPLTDDRVYIGSPEQDERRPRIVLTVLSKKPEHTFDGPAGYTTGQMQVACLAPKYADARAIADAAAPPILDNYEGAGFDDSISIDYLEIDDDHDIPSMTPVGQPQPMHGIALVVNFQFQTT